MSRHVRCLLRNPLLSQLWCAMISLTYDILLHEWTHGHMTTKLPKKTKTFFVLFQGGKWFMTLCYSSLSKCGATLRPEYIHWDGVLGGRDSGPRHKDSVFSMWHSSWKWFGMFAVQDIQIFGCIFVCVVLLLRLWQWVEDFLFCYCGCNMRCVCRHRHAPGRHSNRRTPPKQGHSAVFNRSISLRSLTHHLKLSWAVSHSFASNSFASYTWSDLDDHVEIVRLFSQIYISQILQELRPLRTSLKLEMECKGVMLPMEILTAWR